MPFGRTLLSTNTVHSTRLSSDGSPLYKTGAITFDWDTVAAVGSDTTLADGSIIKSGTKFIRYGQVITKITATGKFGPYDPAASDGRQTLAKGNAFLNDETRLQYGGLGSAASGTVHDQFGVIEGGSVWANRILTSGVGVASLAAGPTQANIEATFPLLSYVRN